MGLDRRDSGSTTYLRCGQAPCRLDRGSRPRKRLSGAGISFVEWPDRAGNYLPEVDWKIVITDALSSGRSVLIEALSKQGEACLSRLE